MPNQDMSPIQVGAPTGPGTGAERQAERIPAPAQLQNQDQGAAPAAQIQSSAQLQPQSQVPAPAEQAAGQVRQLEELAACWFLLTGACYHFSSPPIPRVCPLAAALREQFLQEQKWRRLCQRAAAEGDSTACGGLYETLDGQAEHRMEAIRCLLEQMQPLPSGG